jgi:hypothetical protein
VLKGAVRTVADVCGLQPPAIEVLEARVGESALDGWRSSGGWNAGRIIVFAGFCDNRIFDFCKCIKNSELKYDQRRLI